MRNIALNPKAGLFLNKTPTHKRSFNKNARLTSKDSGALETVLSINDGLILVPFDNSIIGAPLKLTYWFLPPAIIVVPLLTAKYAGL